MLSKLRVRARNSKGHFIKDDHTTFINEAWTWKCNPFKKCTCEKCTNCFICWLKDYWIWIVLLGALVSMIILALCQI